MTKKPVGYEADVVVVGSGPGGATVARELSRRGVNVLVCESGSYYKNLGKFYSPLRMMKKGGMTFSEDGILLNIGETVGGLTMVFAATATKPPLWLKEKYGIDLDTEINEVYREVPIQPLPDTLIGPGARLLMESARALGLDWQPLDKYIRPEKCRPNCGACMLGCTTGARWTAREYVAEAERNCAKLLPKTRVEKVLTEGGRAVGVTARGPEGDVIVKAGRVVISAGGPASPVILQRSGLTDVGDGFMVDPVLFVFGVSPSHGNLKDVPITAGIHLQEDGILLSDISASRMLSFGVMAYSGADGMAYMPKALQREKLLCIMVKVRDELNGRVNADGTIYKPLDDGARQRLTKGIGIATEILMKAGVKRKDMLACRPFGGHPGGTVPLGKHLDSDCQTEIKNCYCVDNSIIPEPWGLPPTLTVIAMAKRLAKHLAANPT